jgi:chromosome segregation ATPase
MTKYAKILAVFVSFASMAFLGVTAATLVGGPHWEGEAEAEDLRPFVFSKSDGATVTWSVKTRRGEDSVSSNKSSLAAAVVDARKRLDTDQRGEIENLDKQLAATEIKLQEAVALIAADIRAMQAHEASLSAELKLRREEIEELANEGIEISQQSRAKRMLAGERRADVFRLQNQLDEIRTDRFRAEAQSRKLQDSLVRLQGYLKRAERRHEQLAASGATQQPYVEPLQDQAADEPNQNED